MKPEVGGDTRGLSGRSLDVWGTVDSAGGGRLEQGSQVSEARADPEIQVT